jgi:hypothetical protein
VLGPIFFTHSIPWTKFFLGSVNSVRNLSSSPTRRVFQHSRRRLVHTILASSSHWVTDSHSQRRTKVRASATETRIRTTSSIVFNRSASIVFPSRPPSRLCTRCTHSSGPLATSNAPAEKVTNVSLSLGFDRFQPAFFCLRRGE